MNTYIRPKRGSK